MPDNVRVVDYGIRGFDLALALLEDYEAFILVDAVPRGEAPGTLYTIEVDTNAIDVTGAAEMDPHGMNPAAGSADGESHGRKPVAGLRRWL